MKIPDIDGLRALDVSLKATPTRWWATHKKKTNDWSQCNAFMKIRFVVKSKYEGVNCIGQSSPKDHIDVCLKAWQEVPRQEWEHIFFRQ